MRAFKHSGDNMDKLVLNVNKDKLKAAPGFARDIWPNWLTYGGEVDRYYGETVKLKERPNQKLLRASELIGKNVNDRAGKDMGEIDDIVQVSHIRNPPSRAHYIQRLGSRHLRAHGCR